MKAILDLGTNTFHLLIGTNEGKEVSIIRREYRAVKLGEGGINQKQITPAAFDRGIAVLEEYASIIKDYPVDEVLAMATSAIRNAENGHEFCRKTFDKTGIRIQAIDGNKEAEYIFSGMQLAGCMGELPGLIIDIGGGSVEFILGTKKALRWKQSFEVGAARLMDLFHQSDPISEQNIHKLESYLDTKLADAFSAIEHIRPHYLVGSAGAFETYAELISQQKNQEFDYNTTPRYDFEKPELDGILQALICSTHEQRLHWKGLIPLRVDMIVVASVFTRFILRKTGLTDIRLSTYSLKEGVLHTIFRSA